MMFSPWAIPNDPRIALANMNAIFPDRHQAVKVYECVSCGTTFRSWDGEHKDGYLVCPSCWDEDIREVHNDRSDNQAKQSTHHI